MSLDAVKRVMEVEKQASQQREEGEREARRRITAAEKAGAERLESACRAAEIKVKKMMTEEEEKNAKETAEREGVDIRLYRVIYNAIEDIEAAIKGMLDPVYREKVIGHVEVRQIYKASGVGTIAGCYVLDGTITKDAQSRIVRDGIVIYEGELASLKRFKDDVKEVKAGFECGIVFEKYNDIKEGDIIEVFVMEEIKRTKKSKVQQISQEHVMNNK